MLQAYISEEWPAEKSGVENNTKVSWGCKSDWFSEESALLSRKYFTEKCYLRSAARIKAFQPVLRVQELRYSDQEYQQP